MLRDDLGELRGPDALGSRLFRLFAYPFFLLHLLLFGGVGFVLAYADLGVSAVFLYAHGIFAVAFFLPFYRRVFGREEIKWMWINAALGILGICSDMDWLISASGAGSSLGSYPFYVHPVPFLYYIMYTFLLRQVVLDLTGARERPERRRIVEHCYVGLWLLVHAAFYFL